MFCGNYLLGVDDFVDEYENRFDAWELDCCNREEYCLR